MSKQIVLKTALAPLQFSDSAAQKAHDVDVLFGRGYDVMWGTESGENPLLTLVRRRGESWGYVIQLRYSNWVAVRREIIVPGSIQRGFEPWVKAADGAGKHSDRGLPWIGFEHVDLNGRRVTAGAGHMLTHGRTPSDPNWRLNGKFAGIIADWGNEHGAGGDIVLYAGDQNTDDKERDTFRGKPFTSCWDETGKWPGTGHGTIDVIATYDRDRRVSVLAARSLNDRRVMLHTDHWLTEADIAVKTG